MGVVTTFAPGTLLMAGLLTLLTSSQGLLTTASKTGDSYAYDFATVPFLAELTKLGISYYLLLRQRAADPASIRMTRDWRTVALFIVPSIIYMFHNNVQFFFLKYVDPATYQILGNLKIVTTGLLLRVALNRQLSRLQWMALLLLMTGAATSQINTDCTAGVVQSVLHAPFMGYVFGVVSALLSAVAAVYTEWVLKKNNDTLYWQNMLLYGFGSVFNLANLAHSKMGAGSGWNVLQGYSLVTWLVVANLAFSGLLVSWVMKFADSIVKVYATSLAMLLTTLVSIAFFSLQPTLQMALGIVIASCSVVLYYVPPAALAAPPEAPSKLPRRSAIASMADDGAALEEPSPSGEEAMRSQTTCGLDGPCAIDPRRLKLRKNLGAGAFANVKAAQLRPGAPSSAAEYGALSRDGSSEVAVKVLRPELLPHPHQVQQFLKEVDLLRSLRHRNIVGFIGCCQHCSLEGCMDDSARGGSEASKADGADWSRKGLAPQWPPNYYFVQELCGGGSLGELLRRQLIRRYKPLDADALRWSLHIAGALQYLHESSPAIMHRDLKLDNVLLTSPDTSVASAKLADFGLARFSPVDEPEAPGTPRRVELCRSSGGGDLTGRTGSYGVMAPEVLENRPYNASADIFSLGMCMHNLFARSLPCFDGSCQGAGDHMEVFARKVAAGYRPPLPPSCAAPVVAVIEACWHGEPARRPSARSVVKMLELIRDSGSLPASTTSEAAQGCGCTLM
ncbi:CMP-sialic acid transporter 1 [Chlorella vulgaris]